MYNTFDEVKFLTGVKQLNAQVLYVYNDAVCKRFMKEVILNYGFDKNDVFQYFKNLISSHLGICVAFDVDEWKDIYDHFIKNPRYPRVGKMLKDGMGSLTTSGEYELYFINTVETYGLNADSMLTEIVLDSLGWLRLLDTLVDMADEMGIVVETLKVKKSKKSKVESSVPAEVVDAPVTETVSSEVTVSEDYIDVEHTTVEEVKVDEHPKKSKRGYSIPVCQYKKVAVFDTIDVAAATTGIEVDTLLAEIETQPSEAVSYVWKYTNKSKTQVAQYELLHTYKNQNDINTQSFEVCGKKISHSNVAPKLKEWKQVSKEEFVWVRVAA